MMITDPRDKTIRNLNQGLTEVIASENAARAECNAAQKRNAELEALLIRVLRGEVHAN